MTLNSLGVARISSELFSSFGTILSAPVSSAVVALSFPEIGFGGPARDMPRPGAGTPGNAVGSTGAAAGFSADGEPDTSPRRDKMRFSEAARSPALPFCTS